MASFKDLREWINQVREIGELAVIEGADPKGEMGAIGELSSRNQGPAILHSAVKGYPPNFRVLTNMMSNIRTFNLAFGFPLENNFRETIQSMRTKVMEWERDAAKFPPKVVETGPIMENVVKDDQVDLKIFPVPTWHEKDGGPYIGTADAVITRDRETGQVNVGTYRSQLHDGQNVGMMVTHGHHADLHRQGYFEKGEPCPVVILYGIDPLLFGISASNIGLDIPELNYVGAVRGAPVPVIKGRVTGLPIPAYAEIAVEGYAFPNATRLEGRFGEWQGYYAGGATEQPFVKVSTLYYRNDPILTGAPPGKGSYCDFTFFFSVSRSAHIWNELVAAGVPGVKGVYLPMCGCAYYIQVVSIKQQYGGHAAHAGLACSGSRSGAFAGRYTIIVDDDVDPYDIEDVMWAVSTRSQPSDNDLIKKSWGSHSEPLFRRTSAERVDSTPSRAIIYAVKPYEWRHEFAEVNLSSEDLRKQVLAKWKDAFNDRLKVL